MIKLTTDKMNNAIAKAKQMRPRVRRVADRTYTVSGSRGNAYTVRFAVQNGHKLSECNCAAGRAGQVCYHVAAAAALNIALHSTYSKPSETPKAAAHIIKQVPHPQMSQMRRMRVLACGESKPEPAPQVTAAPKPIATQFRRDGNAMIIDGWAV